MRKIVALHGHAVSDLHAAIFVLASKTRQNVTVPACAVRKFETGYAEDIRTLVAQKFRI